MDGIYRLTQLGKKRAGSIYSSKEDDGIVAYLRENKTASEGELSSATGKPTSEVRAYLRKLEREGLVERVGGG